MTAIHRQLARLSWLLIACLALALGAAPPDARATLDSRDASALSVRAPSAGQARGSSGASVAAQAVSPSNQQHVLRSAPAPRISQPQRVQPTAALDRRYLYLELVTLLS